MTRSHRVPSFPSLFLALCLFTAGLSTSLLAQAEDAKPVPEDEAKEKTDQHKLGSFIEVIVIDRDLNEFQGWIRSKARVEIFDSRRVRYLQLLDTAANRELDNAGLRVYYVDGMEGHVFIKHSKIDEIVTVRKISAKEERQWEAELERQLLVRIELLRKQAELKAEEERQREQDEQIDTELSPEVGEPVEIPADLKRGYRLLEEFPPGEWGASTYRRLQRIRLERLKTLTIDERRFVESYPDDWKPAYEHQQANQR